MSDLAEIVLKAGPAGVVAALLLASCGSTRATPALVERPVLVVAGPSESSADDHDAARSADRERRETWEGEYVCPQGVTALTLHLTRHGDASLEAIFMFRASEKNPGVPTGAFTLAGQMRPDGSFELTPSHWIDQPPRYVMVGMAGDVDASGTTMRGRITEDVCGGFELHRVPAR